MLNKFDIKTQAAVTHFQEDIKNLRTGRASAAMLDGVAVLAYGAKVPLAQVASISIADPKQIVVEAWDKGLTKDIEKAIIASPLALSPAVDGNQLRIKLPDLTAEVRQRLAKVLHEKAEEARVQIRRGREDTKKTIDKDAKAGAIREDERFALLEKLDKKTKDRIAEIEAITATKEKEIMTV